MGAVTNSRGSRFGDTPLSFEVSRFVGPGDAVRWRFSVSRFLRSPALIEIDATPEILREIGRFVEAAAALVETDGNRTTEQAERPGE